MSVDFLVHEVGARIVAIVLGVWVGRELWFGFLDRKIVSEPSDLIDLLLTGRLEFRREGTPIVYWLVMFLKAVMLLCCAFAAIFGWS